MKIWLFSDLHLHHAGIARELVLPVVPEADVAVCAGDLIEGDPVGGVHWLAEHIRPRMPSIYVMGNHEFYNPSSNMQRLRSEASEAASRLDVHLLDDGVFDIGGIQFFGSTIWTDFDLFGRGDEARRFRDMAESERWMNDFRLIRAREDSGEKWSPAAARRQHLISLTWLETSMSSVGDRRKVVVSHHAPHFGSVAPKYREDPLTAAFASDLGSTIARYRPELWLHGHMHHSSSYNLGATRLACNPKGYGAENAGGFNPGLVIEI